MRTLYCIAFLAIFSISLFAQNANIVFRANKDCEILIYKPIDGGYQDKIPADRLLLNSKEAVNYKSDVSSYSFIYCQFPQYQSYCNLLVFPEDSIQVYVSEEGITFQGSNHTGLQYYYDNFNKSPNLEKYLKIQNVFKEYITNKRELHTILPTIDDTLGISSIFKTIEDFPKRTNTKLRFSEILKKEVYMFISSEIIPLYRYALSEKQKDKSITMKDSLKIQETINSIYKQLPISYELQKYPSNLYVWKYFGHYYGNNNCPEGYEPDMCGPYTKYLFAPTDMQPSLLGHACLVQLRYNTGEMNLYKLKRFFNEKYPNSEYTLILNERIKENEDSIKETTINQFFIKESINSLADLKNTSQLKGKYIFIDLWASWCMPCRAEFSFKKELHQILDIYKNIATVYISIDNEKQEKAWHNCIKHYKLEGYHLRATAELQKDIRQQVYGTDSYDIPRYILIGPNGSVLNKDLPRPSDYPKLKEELDKAIYSKPIPK